MTLSALFVARAKAGRGAAGKYHDGGNLILRIKPGGRASWVFRFSRAGKQTALGLGSLRDISLADARAAAARHRRTLALDGDPLREKRARRAASMPSFDQAAAKCIADRKAGWKNGEMADEWASTLKRYAGPTIGALAVADIDTQHVIEILKPIWTVKPDTASKLRGRIEAVLDWAKLHSHRAGENPARWRGHLALVFPAVGKVRRSKPHAAVPIDALPATFAALAALGTITAEAVMFAILCTARPGEVQLATWPEIDLAAACWQLPGERTKTGKPHRVPLSAPALALLQRRLADRRDGEDLVFPGNGEAGRPQWSTAMLAALRTASGSAGVTVHGTARSTFDDWASERTAHPQKCIDRALGHGPKGKTTQAYRRSDLYEQRKPLMADWGAFLDGH